jgi:hypothetical protein
MRRVLVKGDRVEARRNGILLRGTVQFVSLQQILVKWDDGSSSDLLADGDSFRILDEEDAPERVAASGD